MGIIMKCEFCQIDHVGEYGSGRFCCESCARKFSTSRDNLSDLKKSVCISCGEQIFINKRASQNKSRCKKCFPGKYNTNNKKYNCMYCDKLFIPVLNTIKFCSSLCRNKGRAKFNSKTLKTGRKPGSGGFRERGGKAIQYEYINIHNEKMKLNKEEIEVAKILDKLKLNWCRNKKFFNYVDIDGNPRKFYPDFYVSNFDLYVEYKGWVTDKMEHKMKNALENNDFKLLIIYGNDKRYKNKGLNLKDLQNDNSLLYKCVADGDAPTSKVA